MKRVPFLLLGFVAVAGLAVTQITSQDSVSDHGSQASTVMYGLPRSAPAMRQAEAVSPVAVTVQNQNAAKTGVSMLSPAVAVETTGVVSDGTAAPTSGKYTTTIPEDAVLASQSENAQPGTVIVPDTSLEKSEDVGVRSHTNHLFIKPDEVNNSPMVTGQSSPSGESPQSLRAVYNLPSTGGSGIIAIISAYHYPTALNDFNVFSRQFSLPVESSTVATASTNTVFQVVFATGKQPAVDSGWAQESALDIEWAHAMAPNAKIVLVEAASSSDSDLNKAVLAATKLTGVHQISMSWGSSEYYSELFEDSQYVAPGVVFFAASGDVGGRTIYPGTSPNVVSAGGTTINRSSSKAFVSETAWSSSGGGKSRYEARPAYQARIATIVGFSRGVPDLSFDANPNTGVAVYDSTSYYGSSGWMVFGGTSVSSPALAGIVNLAGAGLPGTVAELGFIYANLGTANFRDITSGRAGSYNAVAGWDFVTGVGSVQGLKGK